MILFLTILAKKLTLTYLLYLSLDLDEVFKVHKNGAIHRPPNISRKIKKNLAKKSLLNKKIRQGSHNFMSQTSIP